MKFENQEYYNCEVELDNGEKYLLYANTLHNEQLDFWQGYECAAGSLRLYIDKDFDIYSAECRNDYLGNALTGFTLMEDYTICKRNRCTGCTDDLIINKRKRNYDN